MRNWMHRIRRRAPFAVFLCVVVAAATAGAGAPCTKTFVPGTFASTISWHDGAKWDPIGEPGPADVACIFTAGNYQITVTNPVTVAGLQIDVAAEATPSVKIISTDFTLNGAGYLAGATKLKVNDGAVLRSDTGGAIEVHSKLVIEGGTVQVDIDLYGHLNWWGPASVTGTLTKHPGSVMEVEDPQAPAHLIVTNGFENHGSMVFNDTVEQSLTVISGELLNAADGTIRTAVCSGLPVDPPEFRGQLDNLGLLDVDCLPLRIVGDGVQHLNATNGEIQVSEAELWIDLDGDLEVPSNFTNYGSITVAGGGSVRVNGSTGALDVPSNFTNYGSITVAGGGSIRVNGSTGESPAMAMVNFGLIDLLTGGDLTIVDSTFDNHASGQVSGTGTLDLTEAEGGIFNGTLSPGSSSGIFTVDGSLEEGASAEIIIEVGGESPGVNLDRLDVTDELIADGTLRVDLLHSYHPEGGEQYEVLTFGQLLGEFDAIKLPTLMNSLVWNVVPTTQTLWLEVGCQGTQLGIDIVADNDPVSVGEDVTYFVTVANLSTLTATDVVVLDVLPGSLIFQQQLSSPECVAVGSTVECTIAELAPSAEWDLTIVAEAAVAGTVINTVSVDSWECDVVPADNQASAVVIAVVAERCDANFDHSIDSDDVPAAVGHIFGTQAPGNPDCRIGGGVTADDLAATIDASQ